MIRKLIVLFSIIFFLNINCCLGQDRFIKMFSSNNVGFDILISSSDMVYLTGADLQNDEMYILKTDLYGTIIWQKKFFRNCYAPYPRKLFENGPYLTVLGMTNTVPLNCQNPKIVWFAMNIDTTNGNIVNQYVMADTSTFFQNLVDAIILPDNSMIATGTYSRDYIPPNDSDFVFLVKLDENLNTVWSKIISGYKKIEINSIVRSVNNDIFIGGSYEPYMQFDLASLLIKIDTSGTILLSKHFDVPNTGFSILSLEYKDSSLFAGGVYIDNFTGGVTGFMLKYDTLGNYLSAFRYSDVISNLYFANDSSLILQSGGKLIVSDLNINNSSIKGLPTNRQCVNFYKSSQGNLYGVGAPFTLIKFDSTLNTCLNQSYTYSRVPITSFVDSTVTFQEFQYLYDSIGLMNTSILNFSSIELCNSTNDIFNESFDKLIKVFPNPSNSCIKISNNNSLIEDAYYQITDLTGKSLIQGNYNKNECIDVGFLSKGYYFLIIYDENISTIKFVKI